MRPRQWRSFPNLPVNHEAASRWPQTPVSRCTLGLFHFNTCLCHPWHVRCARPCNPTEAPATGPTQPPEDTPWGLGCPTWPVAPAANIPLRTLTGMAGMEPYHVPTTPDLRVHRKAGHLGSSGGEGDREGSGPEALASQQHAVLFMLASLEDSAPLARHKSLTQGTWPGLNPRPWDGRSPRKARLCGLGQSRILAQSTVSPLGAVCGQLGPGHAPQGLVSDLRQVWEQKATPGRGRQGQLGQPTLTQGGRDSQTPEP